MHLTNDTIDRFIDDDYQCKGYVQAHNFILELRNTTFKKLNENELLEFRKTLANALDFTLK